MIDAVPVLRIRGLKKDGMTVRDLISQLRLLKMDSKVVYYDVNGGTHDVIQVIEDGRKVAIF